MNLPDFSQSRRRKLICVVSHDHGGSGSASATLRAKGHSVFEAYNAEQSLLFIEKTPPDIVIVDSGLANYQEISLVSILRLRHPYIPVITLSRERGVEGTAVVNDCSHPGESLLMAGRTLVDILRDVDQMRREPELLNQYA